MQKLVGSVAEDTLPYLPEEAVHTNIFVEDVPDLVLALDDLATEFSPATVNAQLLVEASNMARKLGEAKRQRHQEAVRIFPILSDTSIDPSLDHQNLGNRFQTDHTCEFFASMLVTQN